MAQVVFSRAAAVEVVHNMTVLDTVLETERRQNSGNGFSHQNTSVPEYVVKKRLYGLLNLFSAKATICSQM